MPYFVDGNNLIGVTRKRSRPDEADRGALIAEISARLRSNRSAIVVFFDGAAARTISLGRLSVRADGGSADEAMIRELGKAADPGQVTVVTADRELSRRVRDLGGKTLAPDEFWRRLGARQAAARDESPRVDVEEWANYFADPKNRSR